MVGAIPSGFKPNLAATLTKPELIKFPVYASPKIDGIRCVVFGGVAYSRSLKPIPNPQVQKFFADNARALDGLDGEIVVGRAIDANCMQNSMQVMSKANPLNEGFTFYVFDSVSYTWDYQRRFRAAVEQVANAALVSGTVFLNTVEQAQARCMDDLDTLEARWLAEGYEGMMIRCQHSAYKYGRSTEREGGLVKVKRFTDAEAEVIGFVEEMHNGNETTTDALGRTERSTQASGLTGKGRLGALRVQGIPHPIKFNIGTGFTASQRVDFWNRREELLGQLVTFKHFDHGTVDAPRHPVFKSFRSKDDMS